MSKPTTQLFTREAQQAGFQVLAAEQVRSNRWLLQLVDGDGQAGLLVVQARPLVGAADVQDLAELVQLRRLRYGILLAYQGVFSPAAHRTLAELNDQHLRLCTALPPAARAEPDGRSVPALKSTS